MIKIPPIFRLVGLIIPIYLFFNSFNIAAQTPGVIVEGDLTITGGLYPNGTPLDPNGDGYTSKPPSETPSQYTNIGFPANILATDTNDVLYSEIAYVGIPEITAEPTADLNKGPSCAFTDLVQDADSRSSYYNTDGTNMRFRFRLGGAASNSKGYSILIDTDEKFGFDGPNADPDAEPGNPGFEIEIVLRTNFEVNAYDVNDLSSITELAALPYTTHAIKSLALTTVCNDPDYFYDFYIPFTDIAGIDNTTKLRMVSVTAINPKGVLGNNGTSDIAGVDDGSDATDNLYIDTIDTQTPTNGDPVERASCPLINGPIQTGTGITITGTTAAMQTGETTEVEVFVDGTSVGTTTTTTTSWSYTFLGITTIVEGEKITATATVTDASNKVVKGTSIDSCDIETASDTICTPLATPTFVSFSSNKNLNLSYAAGTPAGTSFIFNFYDASTGAQITTIDGVNVVNRTSTIATRVSIDNGKKFSNETLNFIVTVDTNPSSCESLPSEPISTCNSGGVSATPALNPIEVGDTTITGSFVSPPTSATLRLIINGSSTSITTTTTGSASTFSFNISSLTLSTSDAIKVSNRDFGTACRSTLSAIVSPTAPAVKSLAPTVNVDGCFDGSATVISGNSIEEGATIKIYSKNSAGVTISDTQDINTTTVSDGAWSITLNSPIASGFYVAATVQNIGETESLISNEVLISSITTFTTLLISSDPITEVDSSINGTSSGLDPGSTIQLYLDGDKAFNSSGNELTTTTDGSGNWEFLALDTPLEILYADAVVTVTATSTVVGSCESDQSSSKVVVCNPPTVPTITAVSSTPICENAIFMVTVVNAQPGLLYQLLDQDNNSVGPSFLGPSIAADKTIDSDPLPFGTTSLKVRASKIFGTCTIVESNAISIVVYPSPTITFGANPSTTFDNSTANQKLILTFSGGVNAPSLYSIDFDAAANTASLLDVSSTALPGSQIEIDIPTGLPIGVYNGQITIQEVLVNSCDKSYPITITILDPSAPEIELSNVSVALCSGATSADFNFSGTTNTTNTPIVYSIDFNDAANLQGFTDIIDITLPSTGASTITVTVPPSPDGGTYTGVIQLKDNSGLLSQEYPISIAIEETTPGVVTGNQIVLSTTDLAVFESTEGATGLGGVTYQWQKSTVIDPFVFSDISGATSATYDEGTIAQTTYYKRIATSVTNSCTAESNIITVSVITLDGIPMITQVYQVGDEKWIEITNNSGTSISANQIYVHLLKDKSSVFGSPAPDASLTIGNVLADGASVLIKSSSITGIPNIPGTPLTNDNLTELEGGNDMIFLSATNDATAWENRYDIVSNFDNKTSLVRIDETTTTNSTYTESEWVTFIDDAILTYGNQLTAAQEGRHPHAPLISEITASDTQANTLLGLHRIGRTTRTTGSWNNGVPDRSRFVVIDEDYNHGTSKLSARKLTVNNKLGIENLLVVTNDVVLGASGEIRLIDATEASNAQFIQTHTSASLVTGSGKLLVDQNSTVPSLYRYNYLGSPVKGSVGSSTYTIANVLKDGTNPTSFSGVINESSATGIAKDISFLVGDNYDGNFTNSPNQAITLADYWMYTYASSGGGRSNWDRKRSGGTIATPDGFILKGPGRPQNYTFLGIPKDGTITTTVGANESYLIANPYASAISVKEFIEDNLSAITGTLYFWKHAGENESSGIDGHYFSGYIGGYATRTISTGVTAKAENLSGEALGPIDQTIEAEDAIFFGDEETIDGTDVILLNSATDSITFMNIAKGVDSLRIRYQSSITKSINIKVNDISKLTVNLESTGPGILGVKLIPICVLVGSNITIASTDTNAIQIDYLNLYDSDGAVECNPSEGDLIFTEPEPYIAIGQGFFVTGDSDGGAIEFNNSQREYQNETVGGSVFFKSASKSSSKNTLSLPVIKLGMDFKDTGDGNNYHRQIAVSFSNYTSFDYDKGYDALMYDVGSTDIYWKFLNNEDKYVIAGVQAISNDLQVPLEITMGYSGNVTIKTDEIKNVNKNVYITDKVTDISYDIINSKATIFLDKGTYTDRFVLSFTESTALTLQDEILLKYVTIFADNKNHNLMISKNEEVIIKNVELYNILGKKVGLWSIEEQKSAYQLKIKEQLPTGVYIVKMNSNKGKINKKIVIE